MVVVLITTSYPYDGAAEQTFIEPELRALTSSASRVILVPAKRLGKRLTPDTGVEVNESYAQTLSNGSSKSTILSRAVCSRLLWNDLIAHPWLVGRPRGAKLLTSYTSKAELTRNWVTQFLLTTQLSERDCVFYTYWFLDATTGIGLAKQGHPGIKLISRAHGFDVYEHRHNPPYLPCRRFTLSAIDWLFPDSDRATAYLSERFRSIHPRCETARMGVSDPAFLATPSTDGTFRIVSCSLMAPVKRLDLMLQGVTRAAELRPNQQFEWRHFGTGPLKEQLETSARSSHRPNLNVQFPGYESQAELLKCYRAAPVDLFINTSQSEGTPVAVMEAISCGIPVLATAVGGNPEIVSERNGRLLPANPSPDEIAQAILSFLDDPAGSAEKRTQSRQVWRERYCAETNYQNFARQLLAIRQAD